MVFREGRTKAVGNVTTIFPYVPGTSASHKGKQSSKAAKAKVHGEKGGKKKRSKSKSTTSTVTTTTTDEKKTDMASNSDVNLTLTNPSTSS